jgi:hypothetical protein
MINKGEKSQMTDFRPLVNFAGKQEFLEIRGKGVIEW